jgi:transposase InsO family protein
MIWTILLEQTIQDESNGIPVEVSHTETSRPHQIWATDASYFRVTGSGFCYLVTVMDDFFRFILAWRF